MIFLIIDKEKRWANYVKNLLENKGHQVEILEEYKKATEHTRETDLDLIFYDSQLFNENQKFATLPHVKDIILMKLNQFLLKILSVALYILTFRIGNRFNV